MRVNAATVQTAATSFAPTEICIEKAADAVPGVLVAEVGAGVAPAEGVAPDVLAPEASAPEGAGIAPAVSAPAEVPAPAVSAPAALVGDGDAASVLGVELHVTAPVRQTKRGGREVVRAGRGTNILSQNDHNKFTNK